MPAIDTIKIRRGTASEWAIANPILGDGEQGWERDTRLTKTGDGTTAWNDLDYDAADASITDGDRGGVTVSGSGASWALNVPTVAEVLAGVNNTLAVTAARLAAAVPDAAVSVLRAIPQAEHAAIIDGTSTYDATADIQGMIDSLPDAATLAFPRGLMRHGNIVIEDRSGFTIASQGTHVLEENGATPVGFQMLGTLDGFSIIGATIVGDGDKTRALRGVYSLSNASLAITDLLIRDCHISAVPIGVQINAETAGSIDGFLVAGCTVSDIVGIASGQGYGFNVATTDGSRSNGALIGNRAINCGRHSFYVARGGGVIVANNIVKGHRTALTAGEQADGTDGWGLNRAAIRVARSTGVIVAGNYLEGGRDCAIGVNSSDLDICSDVAVIGNKLRAPQDSVPMMIVGTASPSTDGHPTDVLVADNTFFADFDTIAATSVAAIQQDCGKRITYRNNSITILGVDVATDGITIHHREDGSATNNYSDDITFDGMAVHLKTGNASTCRAVRVNTTACASTARTILRNIDPSGDCIEAPATMFAVVTNPNLRVRTRQGGSVGLYTAADTTPSVAGGVTFMSVANAGATSITTLDDGEQGQVVTLKFEDSNTTLVYGANIRLNGSVNFVSTTRDTVTLVYQGVTWFEVGRALQ